MRKQGVRQENLRGPHYLFLSGEEMPHSEFKAMLGMSDRGAAVHWANGSNAACSSQTRHKARCALACRSTRCALCFRNCGPRRRLIRRMFEG